MAKTGLLTGTFDPVHSGHVELAKAAMRAGGLDDVWLMVNPHDGATPASHKRDTAGLVDRLAMAELAVRDVSGVRVYRGPEERQPHNMSTFRRVAELQGAPIIFVVGMDTLAKLDRWSQLESVVNYASFMAAHRDGAPIGAIDELRGRLGSLGGRLDVRLFEFDGYQDVSSTDIRARLRMGERANGLDPEVYEYVLAHHLYR